MIVTLRGCSGAGKSTVVTTIMGLYPTTPIMDDVGKKPIGYRVDVPDLSGNKPLFIVGRYTTACGGCDTVKTQQDIVDLAKRFHADGHVLLEGLLLSGGYGTVGRLSEDVSDYVFATLDTPLEVALERVKQRRLAAGNDKPLDPTNTKSKFDSTRNVMKKMLADPTKKTVWIDHTNAVEQVLGLFK